LKIIFIFAEIGLIKVTVNMIHLLNINSVCKYSKKIILKFKKWMKFMG